MIYTRVKNERILQAAYEITKDETLKDFIEFIPQWIHQCDAVYLAINDHRLVLLRDLYPEQGDMPGKDDNKVSNENFRVLLKFAFAKDRLHTDYIKNS